MKNWILLLMLGMNLLLIFQGCKNKVSIKDVSSPTQTTVMRKSSQRAELTNGTYVRAHSMYQDYTSQQKYLVWKDKLEDVLERAALNTSQREFIESVLENLSSSYFETQYSDEALTGLLNDAQNYFDTQAEMARIFCTPFDFDESPTFMNQADNVETLKCHCSHSFTCTMGNTGSCNSSNCGTTNNGCGFLWLFKCQWICDAIPIQ